MDLVVDANILFASLIRDNITAELLFKDEIHLYAPEFLLEELMEHKDELMKKTDRPYEDFFRFTEIVKRIITFYPYSDFKKFIDKAASITPDIDDTEYIALALYLKADIWSNDRSLKGIKEIDVYSTMDIIRMFK